MSLGPGSTIGPFKIQSLIGKGGMGEVFSAVDTRLERRVAVKLLPEDFASDAPRLQRFQSEAKTLASLNHPNILSIFEVGAQNGNPYLVSELLEGETLREKLSAGPVPQRKTLEYALQIAQGLAAAHARGIIHRDLKPENIFITKDGRVKILDFGLAKLNAVGRSSGQAEPPSEDNSLTLIESTKPGVVLGTVGYMSPEQVRGESADHRSDIFGFGCILYEMLSGRRAFREDSAAETMTAILKQDPTELGLAGTSPSVHQLTRRCLDKSAEHRFQSALDLGFALEALLGSTATSAAELPAVEPARPRLHVIAAVTLGVAVVAWSAFLIGKSRNSHRPASEAQSLNWRGERLGGPNISMVGDVSPDGKELAFAAMENGLTQLGVMMVDSGAWRMLTTNRQTGLIGAGIWARNGTDIYFDRLTGSTGGLYRISKYAKSGAEERLVLDNAWVGKVLPDDSLLVPRISTNRLLQLHRYWIGQKIQPLNAFVRRDVGSAFETTPEGKEVLFYGWPGEMTGKPEGWWVLNLLSGECKLLAESPPSMLAGGWANSPMTFRKESLLYVETAGDLYQIMSARLPSLADKKALATFTLAPLWLKWVADESLYFSQVERPAEILRFSGPNQLQRIPLSGSFERWHVLPLPDGRLLLPSRMASKNRLMILGPTEDLEPFIQTPGEESREPFAMLGNDKVICRLGPSSNSIVAVVSAVDGRILESIESIPADQRLTAVAGSPDGKTIYYVASGVIWALTLEDHKLERIRDGDGVASDPNGKYLILQINKPEGTELSRFSITQKTEQLIPCKYPLTPYPLAPNAVRADGRITVPVAPADLWYWPAVILDPTTGEVEFLPERYADMLMPGWDTGGRLLVVAQFLRSSMWRLRPEHRTQQ